MIVIVNYGMGNLGSIRNMFNKIGTGSTISSSADQIVTADKLVLPGVGAFDNGMTQLEQLGLLEPLIDKVIGKKTPVLGICLGMQLMTKNSEEGKKPGLGWIDARTVRFKHPATVNLKVPHMGWNSVHLRKESSLFTEMFEHRFYFVHSYHAACANDEDVLATTAYGYDFVSAFQHENIIGVQFHPEKSHKFGMQLLKNFSELA